MWRKRGGTFVISGDIGGSWAEERGVCVGGGRNVRIASYAPGGIRFLPVLNSKRAWLTVSLESWQTKKIHICSLQGTCTCIRSPANNNLEQSETPFVQVLNSSGLCFG